MVHCKREREAGAEEEEVEAALFAFKAKELREPNEAEYESLSHRPPTDKEIRQGHARNEWLHRP